MKLPSLLEQYPSASTVILHVGSKDIKTQQSEKLKKDFMSLIDTLLDSRAQCVISGAMSSPCWGDVKFSCVLNLHIWLKGYCRSLGIPIVDNFTTTLKSIVVKYAFDGLYPNWTGDIPVIVNATYCVNLKAIPRRNVKYLPAVQTPDSSPSITPVSLIPLITNFRPKKCLPAHYSQR